MPQWRKLHTKTVESLDLHDMPDDFTRLLWMMLPLGLDRCGRGLDNASWIKAKVMPLREDVTCQMISDALGWYEQHEMIERYHVNGRSYFWIPTWHKYQGDTSKEAESNFPAPSSYEPYQKQCKSEDNGTEQGSQEEVESKSGVDQEEVESKSASDSDADTDADTDAESGSPAVAQAPEHPPPKTPKPATPAQAMFSALAELCQIDIAVCTNDQRGALNQSEASLRKAGATPDALGVHTDDWQTFAHWWYRHDWRGKRGEPPNPHQVREEWGKFTSWRGGRQADVVELPAQSEPTPDEHLWQLILADLQGRMTQATFDAHLRGSVPIDRRDGRLLVAVKREGSIEWLCERLYDSVVGPCVQHHAPGLNVEFIANVP